MLCGKNIYLRLIEELDLKLLVTWRNRPEVWENFYNKFPLSNSGQREWFEQLQKMQNKKMFMICLHEDDSPIGTIALENIDFTNQSLEIGNVLVGAPDCKGRGYGQESLSVLIEYCFSELNMNRVYLHVFSCNDSAIRIYEKCGFLVEGTLRESHFRGGQFRNTLIMSLLRKEFGTTAQCRVQEP